MQAQIARLEARVDPEGRVPARDTGEAEHNVASNTEVRSSMSPALTNLQQPPSEFLPNEPFHNLQYSSEAPNIIVTPEGDHDHFPRCTANQIDTSDENSHPPAGNSDGSHGQTDLQPRHLHAPVTAVNAMSPTSSSTGCDLGPDPMRLGNRSAATSFMHTSKLSWEQSDLISDIFDTADLPRLLFAW